MCFLFNHEEAKRIVPLRVPVAFPLVVAIVAVPSSPGSNVVSDPESRSLWLP
ncbi:hypothetical protein BDV33DRAFT_165144 [Aspergillus novoparasiticus]|uniref:Uncharacterized protein n=1 Tax=Aspergillus novoparasiticus TaxID=986946 RepID=A0A5N6F498_9EURO|nr:hypothetical protein BDV33DRAFT_165144 [Aspergillus novoparasiticus]